MQELNLILSVLLSTFGIILIIVLIVLGIKAIDTLGKLDNLIDDAQNKVRTFDDLFKVINGTNMFISKFSDKIVDNVHGLTSKIFNKRKREDDSDE